MKKSRIYCLIIILMLFSLINNYSARHLTSSYEHYLLKELIWYLLGFVMLWLLSKINLKILFKYSFIMYLIWNLLLFLTLLIGPVINGSTSWLIIGPFSIQPSEFMKIILILYLCFFTSKYQGSDLRYVVYLSLIVLLPSILTFLEPDTGALIPYLIIYLAFLINRGLSKWWYLNLATIVIGSLGIIIYLYYFEQGIFTSLLGTNFFYRFDRLTSFIKGDGYQIGKALTVIGTSGLWGRGISDIPEYFPEAPTDFAFTLLVNNLGLIGTIIFLVIYGLLIFNLFQLIKSANRVCLLPICLILFGQSSINILMNLGLLPIIGITLPLISYGGSNLLSCLLLIGLGINAEPLKKYH